MPALPSAKRSAADPSTNPRPRQKRRVRVDHTQKARQAHAWAGLATGHRNAFWLAQQIAVDLRAQTYMAELLQAHMTEFHALCEAGGIGVPAACHDHAQWERNMYAKVRTFKRTQDRRKRIRRCEVQLRRCLTLRLSLPHPWRGWFRYDTSITPDTRGAYVFRVRVVGQVNYDMHTGIQVSQTFRRHSADEREMLPFDTIAAPGRIEPAAAADLGLVEDPTHRDLWIGYVDVTLTMVYRENMRRVRLERLPEYCSAQHHDEAPGSSVHETFRGERFTRVKPTGMFAQASFSSEGLTGPGRRQRFYETRSTVVASLRRLHRDRVHKGLVSLPTELWYTIADWVG